MNNYVVLWLIHLLFNVTCTQMLPWAVCSAVWHMCPTCTYFIGATH